MRWKRLLTPVSSPRRRGEYRRVVLTTDQLHYQSFQDHKTPASMICSHFTLILAIGIQLVLTSQTRGEPFWNQFRGTYGNGESQAKLPIQFDDSHNVIWKSPIHDKGWSSPVVWGNQIWLTTAREDGTEMFAVCVDANSGDIIHDVLVFQVTEPKFCHPSNSYASCTPYVEQGRVYVHFGEYGTACLDTQTGNKLWERRDFVCEDFRGPASSPIVDGDTLFVHFDGVDYQFVVALDKNTGKTLWRVDRDIDYGTDDGDYKKAFCTPTIIEVDGQRQLISQAAIETIAYEPDTGREIWRVHNEGFNSSARPIYEQGLVFLASGGFSNMALAAVRPDGIGDVTATRVAWHTGKAVPRFASQLVIDGRLFMINDSGVMSCLDAETGKRIWMKRARGEYWASPLYAGGNIYFCSKDGQVLVIRAADECKILAENQFPAGFNASPAVIDDSLILRSFTHLYRIAE